MWKVRRIEDEFEETLSLIDLPTAPISTQDVKSSVKKQDIVDENRACFKTGDDEDGGQSSEFDFGSTRFEMSSADELFLHGQILPLRLSVDSRMTRVVINPGRPDSCSGSSSVEFTSSRSSSYSSSTSSVNCSSNVEKTTTYLPKIRNQFHAHPSPTPILRGLAHSNVAKLGSSRCRKSSVWDVFRLGPVQPPGIELKNLKTRHAGNPIQSVKTLSLKGKNDKQSDKNSTPKQRMFGLGNIGCRCTAEVVENVQTRVVAVKSGERRRSDIKEWEIEECNRRVGDERRRAEKREEVEVAPGRRTFEWLKQLDVK